MSKKSEIKLTMIGKLRWWWRFRRCIIDSRPCPNCGKWMYKIRSNARLYLRQLYWGHEWGYKRRCHPRQLRSTRTPKAISKVIGEL